MQTMRKISTPLALASIALGTTFLPVAGLAQEAEEPTPEATSVPRFACQINDAQPTVMYLPESQPGQAYPWAVPEDMGSAWPAQRRCEEISRRLEQYRPDGLVEMQTAVENGYNTVCVTSEAVPACRIVFTVPPGQDPMATRDRVFENLTLADSGETTQGVNTFVGGGTALPGGLGELIGGRSGYRSQGINLKPFLDASDGGTGTQLNETTGSGGRPLDPDSFR
ncbi:hypothetical protein C7271_06355 [filamentous cyanobacterium CCP5]|nr:hypothetical protein C7271_06355 [filamentous cyanobacterium CCP5]